MRYTKKIIKEKGKSAQEISFEIAREVLLAIIFLIVVLILLYKGREFIVPSFNLIKDATK